MSKAVTTVAALMLYEEGRFMLNEPLGKYLPGFANSVVAVPPPPGSAQQEEQLLRASASPRA